MLAVRLYIYHPPSDMKTPSARKVKCKVCDKRFASAAHLRTHAYKLHYEDDVSDATVSFKLSPIKSVERTNTKCHLCDFDYMIPSELERHNNLRHSVEDSMEDEKLKLKQRQTAKRKIAKPKKLLCHQCCVEFSSALKLNEHYLLHTKTTKRSHNIPKLGRSLRV